MSNSAANFPSCCVSSVICSVRVQRKQKNGHYISPKRVRLTKNTSIPELFPSASTRINTVTPATITKNLKTNIPRQSSKFNYSRPKRRRIYMHSFPSSQLEPPHWKSKKPSKNREIANTNKARKVNTEYADEKDKPTFYLPLKSKKRLSKKRKLQATTAKSFPLLENTMFRTTMNEPFLKPINHNYTNKTMYYYNNTVETDSSNFRKAIHKPQKNVRKKMNFPVRSRLSSILSSRNLKRNAANKSMVPILAATTDEEKDFILHPNTNSSEIFRKINSRMPTRRVIKKIQVRKVSNKHANRYQESDNIVPEGNTNFTFVKKTVNYMQELDPHNDDNNSITETFVYTQSRGERKFNTNKRGPASINKQITNHENSGLYKNNNKNAKKARHVNAPTPNFQQPSLNNKRRKNIASKSNVTLSTSKNINETYKKQFNSPIRKSQMQKKRRNNHSRRRLGVAMQDDDKEDIKSEKLVSSQTINLSPRRQFVHNSGSVASKRHLDNDRKAFKESELYESTTKKPSKKQLIEKRAQHYAKRHNLKALIPSYGKAIDRSLLDMLFYDSKRKNIKSNGTVEELPKPQKQSQQRNVTNTQEDNIGNHPLKTSATKRPKDIDKQWKSKRLFLINSKRLQHLQQEKEAIKSKTNQMHSNQPKHIDEKIDEYLNELNVGEFGKKIKSSSSGRKSNIPVFNLDNLQNTSNSLSSKNKTQKRNSINKLAIFKNSKGDSEEEELTEEEFNFPPSNYDPEKDPDYPKIDPVDPELLRFDELHQNDANAKEFFDLDLSPSDSDLEKLYGHEHNEIPDDSAPPMKITTIMIRSKQESFRTSRDESTSKNVKKIPHYETRTFFKTLREPPNKLKEIKTPVFQIGLKKTDKV